MCWIEVFKKPDNLKDFMGFQFTTKLLTKIAV